MEKPGRRCGVVQADTPLRYVTAFKSTIGERHEKAKAPAPREKLTGAPQKAGERLSIDLSVWTEKSCWVF